jgi:hypothetical protein
MVERIPIDKIEPIKIKNIWGPADRPAMLTFEIKRLGKDLVAYGTRKALPYLHEILKQKKISCTRLETRIRIHASQEALEEAIKGTNIHLEWIKEKKGA